MHLRLQANNAKSFVAQMTLRLAHSALDRAATIAHTFVMRLLAKPAQSVFGEETNGLESIIGACINRRRIGNGKGNANDWFIA